MCNFCNQKQWYILYGIIYGISVQVEEGVICIIKVIVDYFVSFILYVVNDCQVVFVVVSYVGRSDIFYDGFGIIWVVICGYIICIGNCWWGMVVVDYYFYIVVV